MPQATRQPRTCPPPGSRRPLALRARAVGALLFAAALAHTGAVGAQEPKKPELLVFAAASLTDVLEQLSGSWEESSGVTVRLSFAASSVLARQIEAGGEAQVFVSADQEWMDYLAARDLIDKASRRDLAGNRLVLIAPADSRARLRITPGFKLTEALGDGRLAIADPQTVPAGRYARLALTNLGAWDQVAQRLVLADNVRGALLFVARGETPLGIVYATDAQIERKVRVVATFPDNSHPAISYPAAATANAGRNAASYLAWLGRADAAAVWRTHGFLELVK
jgi:molybdate transport system substrate-binding protein